MALEQRRISPRMDLLMSPFSKEMRLMKEATLQPGGWTTLTFLALYGGNSKSASPNTRKRAHDEVVDPGPQIEPSSTLSGMCCGRDANGRLCTASGLGSPPVWSTSVSRDGGAWVSLRS